METKRSCQLKSFSFITFKLVIIKKLFMIKARIKSRLHYIDKYEYHRINFACRAQILCWTSHDPRETLWMLKIQNCCSKVFNFCKSLKMSEKILANPQTFCLLLFYTAYKEKMLTDRDKIKSRNRRWSQIQTKSKVEREDVHEASSKPSSCKN